MTRKRKTRKMAQDRHTNTPASERRDNSERRTENRRAHDRYSPAESARNDRRQSERRRERT
jgi:hypothetical protein